MRRYAVSALLAVALAAPVAPFAPAAGGSPHGPLGGPPGPTAGPGSGRQAFHGFLLASWRTGHREVVASRVVARGVFDGVGRIVEVASRPGDPDNVSRDDLVFRVGTMHVVSRDLHASFHLDRKTCVATADIAQRSRVTGGTRRFEDAVGRFRAHVHGVVQLRRTKAGGCDLHAAPVRELDLVDANGRLNP